MKVKVTFEMSTNDTLHHNSYMTTGNAAYMTVGDTLQHRI